MLYVNLIEERLKARGLMAAVTRFGMLGVVVVAVAVGVLLLSRFLEARDLRYKMDVVRGEIKKLEPDAEECKRTIVNMAKVNPLWQLGDEVITSQQTWGMVLRALSECRPLGGLVSLETMDSTAAEKEKTLKVTLRGFATSEFVISDYQKALNNYKAGLEAQPLLDSNATKLLEVSATTQDGRPVKRFAFELWVAPEGGGVSSVPQ